MITIYFLDGYNWNVGTLTKEGPKNYKITVRTYGYDPLIVTVPKDKCAFADDNVCVVWETWKGKNGRGGYRIERELYANHRVNASIVARRSNGVGRVTEISYGILQDK